MQYLWERGLPAGPDSPNAHRAILNAIGGGTAKVRQSVAQCLLLKVGLPVAGSVLNPAGDPHRPSCRRSTLVLPFGLQQFSKRGAPQKIGAVVVRRLYGSFPPESVFVLFSRW